MKRIFVIKALVVFFILGCHSVIGQQYFSKIIPHEYTIGGSTFKEFGKAIIPNDSSYTLLVDKSTDSGNRIELARTSYDGEKTQRLSHLEMSADVGRKEVMKETKDGHYLTFGSLRKSREEIQGALIKFEKNGDTVWTRELGSDTTKEYFQDALQTEDSNIVATGGTISQNGNEDFWLVKFNKAGKVIWENQFNYDGDDRSRCLTQAPDGGYVMAGWTIGFDREQGKYINEGLIIKTDSAGNQEWTRHFPYKWGMGFKETIVYKDRILVIGGQSQKDDFNTVGVIYSLDLEGNTQWDRYFWDWYSFDMKLAKLSEKDSTIVIGGDVSETDTQYPTGMLMKIKPKTGEKLWMRKFYFDPLISHYLKDFKKVPGGFVITGYAIERIEPEIWLAKVDSVGCDTPNCTKPIQIPPQQSVKEGAFRLYPNPANEQITIQLPDKSNDDQRRQTIRIYDINRREVRKINVKQRQLTIPVASLPPGIYTVQLLKGDQHHGSQSLHIE